MDVHGALAKRLGVEEASLRDLSNYASSANFSELERAALAVAVALTREPRALPKNLRNALVGLCGHDGFEEIVATVGLFNYLTRLHNGCGASA
uniref:Carboxymuconolactone decarboxylase family protein n=1 Tax=mine drainage metagenome TaxID=410659 RepID=E6Q6V5_9ZZZZ